MCKSPLPTLIRLIAEGSGGEDDEADENLRVEAVETFLDLLEPPEDPTVETKKSLPSVAIYVIAWVLGNMRMFWVGKNYQTSATKLWISQATRIRLQDAKHIVSPRLRN